MKIFVDEYSNYELKTLLRRIYRNDISIINNYNKLHYLGKSAYAILSQSNYNIHGNYLIIYSTVEYTFFIVINNEGSILNVYTTDVFPMDEHFNFVGKNEVMDTINNLYGETIELVCVMGILYGSLTNKPYMEDYGFMPEIIEHVVDDTKHQFITDYFPDTKLVCFNNVKINGTNNMRKVDWLYSVSSQPFLYVTDTSVSYIDHSTDTHITKNNLDNETIINYVFESREDEDEDEDEDYADAMKESGLINSVYSYMLSFF